MAEQAPSLDYRLLRCVDIPTLEQTASGVFDGPVKVQLAAAFERDPRHHMAVALHEGRIVGFASAVDYLHPDKPPQLWINEVGISPEFRGNGVGKRLLTLLLEEARRLGCTEAWVLTDPTNEAAKAMYRNAGAVEAAEQIMYTFAVAPEAT